MQYVVHINKQKCCQCVASSVYVRANSVVAYTKCVNDYFVCLLDVYRAKLRTVLSHRMWISSDRLLVVASDEMCI